MIKHECKMCKKVFLAQKSANRRYCSIKCKCSDKSIHVSWNRGKKLPYTIWNKGKTNIYSKKLLRRWSKIRKGVRSGHWKGGKIRYGNKNNYWAIYSPKHPFSDGKGYVMEHRILMEKSIHRYLKPTEVVHHINGVYRDNRIENLRLFKTTGKHSSFHSQMRKIMA